VKGKQLKFRIGIFQNAARQIGAKVVLNGVYGLAGQVKYKSGATRYFRRFHFDLNPLGASEIAKYKCYASFFIAQMGYPVIAERSFFSDAFARELGSNHDIHAAYRYAKSIGFPVVVKPNSKGQGEGVAKVYNRRDFYRCMREVFKGDSVALVQEVVTGTDYRLVVLDDAVISAFERRPLEVTGDGKSTIRKLLEARQQFCKRANREMKLNLTEYRLLLNLRRRKLGFHSVLPKGERLRLLDNANLSTGGESRDVTKNVHPKFKQIAVDVTRKMGLRLCGVDFMVQGDINDAPATYWIIELNASPGLDSYAAKGKGRAKVLQDLFAKVLKAME
jgi:D-alanine-D-alanine ligase-like ATP-grasp enzyme